jgi:hypothetical protein
MQKNKNVKNTGTNLLIAIGIIITLTVMTGFFYLAYKKGLMDLPINEIGDSFSGFSSFLAFLWLTITVILQSSELKLQRVEISELKDVTGDQANSLKQSTKIQGLTYLRSKQQDSETALNNINKETGEDVEEFLRDFNKFEYAYEFKSKPERGIKHILAYFINADAISNENNKFNNSLLRKDFPYEAYLLVQNIMYNMERVWEILSPLREYAEIANVRADQKAWEVCLHVDWYEKNYKQVAIVKVELSKLISKGGIANDFVTSLMRAYVDDPINGNAFNIDKT